MTNRLAVSLIAMSLLASGSAFAQSTTVQGAQEGARVGGPVGAIVGGTVGAALEIPNAVITAIPRGERSVVVQERVVVGEGPAVGEAHRGVTCCSARLARS